jgi:quinohemoprotein ethanol dehydrogenase
VGNGVTPDLRYSGALDDPDAWRSIVIDGALKDNGMVSFASWLKPEDAEAIRHYVADQSQRFVASAASGK